jgi:hypothetical protein
VVRLFIASDIEREIQLVRGQELWRKRIARKIWGSYGANVLSALGLLCYTEFAGRLKRDHFSDGIRERVSTIPLLISDPSTPDNSVPAPVMSHNWIEQATQVRVRLIASPRATS